MSTAGRGTIKKTEEKRVERIKRKELRNGEREIEKERGRYIYIEREREREENQNLKERSHTSLFYVLSKKLRFSPHFRDSVLTF